MEGIYDILQGGEKIGKVQVQRQGLYYRFSCCCDLTGEVMHRITVTCGSKTENLGIPIPDGDCFRLTARLPISRFDRSAPKFQVIPHNRQKMPDLWVPISPETPFAYIHRLEHGILERHGAQMGILISEEAPQDSDLSPSHPHE